MSNKTILRSAMVSAIALGVMTASGTALAAKGDNEKCYGVAAAGKNDCQTATSSCAGTSHSDNQADAWIYVPKGTCEKIAGGSTEAPKS